MKRSQDLPEDTGSPEIGRMIISLCSVSEHKVLVALDYLLTCRLSIPPSVQRISREALLPHATTSAALNKLYKSGVLDRYSQGREVYSNFLRQDVRAHFDISARRTV